MIDKIEELCVCDNCGEEIFVEKALISRYNFCKFDCYDIFLFGNPKAISPDDTVFIKGE